MIHFDARTAKQLQPGAHLTWDACPGLRLVATATRRAWVYRYKSPADGRMRQVKLGAWPAMTPAAAVAAWEGLRARRDAGEDPAAQRRTQRREAVAAGAVRAAAAATGADPARAVTLGALWEAHAESYAAHRRAPKGLQRLAALGRLLTDEEKAMPAAAVSRSAAYDLIWRRADRPVQAGELRRELGAVWEWAQDSGRLSDDVPNWWRLILRGKLASKGKIVQGQHQGMPVKRVLSPAEVGAVLRHLPHLTTLVSDLLTLYLWTGCRGEELCEMEGAEVSQEPDGWWWTVPRSKLKTAKHPLATDLRVPLIGRALAIVQARMDVHGGAYLFPARNANAKTPHVQQKVLGVAVWSHMPDCESRPDWLRPRWPVTGWAPHDLRRTVRTQLTAIGCPTDAAEAIIGHIQPGIQGVYNRHQYDAERRLWLGRLVETWEAAQARPAQA